MSNPPVILIGSPEWQPEAHALLLRLGFRLIRYQRPARYVARLSADQPALILIDGGLPDRDFWITTPRVSPATRRIPVVVISGDEAVRRAALAAGATFALAPDDLAAELPALLAGRAGSEAVLRAMQSQCGQPLPPDAAEAIRRFNTGEFYKQHDLFEALWMEEPGPVRSLYQAILQVGIAYYQITRGNRRGALKMLLRARQWLAVLPEICQGVDVARLRADADRVQAALEAIRDEDIAAFDRSLLRPVVMTKS